MTEWSKLPKQSARSPSTNQLVPVQVWATSRNAVWQPRPGRKPWERSENVGSYYASRSRRTTSATSLSDQVGRPNGRSFPDFFGMYTRRTGLNR